MSENNKDVITDDDITSEDVNTEKELDIIEVQDTDLHEESLESKAEGDEDTLDQVISVSSVSDDLEVVASSEEIEATVVEDTIEVVDSEQEVDTVNFELVDSNEHIDEIIDVEPEKPIEQYATNQETAVTPPPLPSPTATHVSEDIADSAQNSEHLSPPPLPKEEKSIEDAFEEYTFNKQPKKKKNKVAKKRNSAGFIAAVCCIALVVGIGGGIIGSKIFYTMTKQPNSTVNNVINTSDVSTLAGAVSKVAGPSVVEIQTETVQKGNYFGNYTSQGAGSGVIYSEDGYIITNYHVIEGATQVKVYVQKSADGESEEYDAKVVGVSEKNDLAVLKINASGLATANVGKSGDMQLGDFVLAIGNPLGELGGTVTDGIISALDREIQVEGSFMRLLQTNAAVNPGNSGGGLFNSKGELIGIVNAKQAGSDIEGLGFAIPTDTAIPIVEEIIKNGDNYQEVQTEEDTVSLGVKISETQEGVLIQEIIKGSPAEKAGLEVGDIILRIDRKKITTIPDLKDALTKYSYGDEVEIRVQRDGANESISLTF